MGLDKVSVDPDSGLDGPRWISIGARWASMGLDKGLDRASMGSDGHRQVPRQASIRASIKSRRGDGPR